VGLVRPVTVCPIVKIGADKGVSKKVRFMTMPEINSFECVNAGLLALLADARTARELIYSTYRKDTGHNKAIYSHTLIIDGVVSIPKMSNAGTIESVEHFINLINLG
jgi:hypothetical protein